MRPLLAGLLLGVAACAATPMRTTVVSFVDLDCSNCGDDMARALIQVDGVKKTAFDALMPRPGGPVARRDPRRNPIRG